MNIHRITPREAAEAVLMVLCIVVIGLSGTLLLAGFFGYLDHVHLLP